MSMLNRASQRLYQLASPRIFLFSAVLFGIYIGIIMPGAVDVPRITGSGEGLLGFIAYSAGEFYTQIGAMSADEQQLFIRYRLYNDMGWIFTMAAFFTVSLSSLLKLSLPDQHKLRQLNLLGLLPPLLDLSENLLQIVLVQHYPEEYLFPTQICSVLTTLKWLALNICLLLIIIFAVTALVRSIKKRLYSN